MYEINRCKNVGTPRFRRRHIYRYIGAGVEQRQDRSRRYSAAGFSDTLVAAALSNPTAMALAPDGRIFVCQQVGDLRGKYARSVKFVAPIVK